MCVLTEEIERVLWSAALGTCVPSPRSLTGVFQLEAKVFYELRVALGLLQHGIYDDGLPGAHIRQQIAVGAALRIEQLLEKLCVSHCNAIISHNAITHLPKEEIRREGLTLRQTHCG